MKKIKSITLLSLFTICPLFIGCDGGSSADSDDASSEVRSINSRGLDLTEILANPTDTPGFPYSLAAGETITFIPTNEPANSFIERVPLGTWVTESSGFLRQGADSAGTFSPVGEDTFRHLYTAGTLNSQSGLVSAENSIVIQYAFEHTIVDRLIDFVPKINQIIGTAAEPGSLFNAVSTGGGSVSARDETIVNAITSLGIAAVEHPDGDVFESEGNLTNVVVRTDRSILLYNITSTNANLDPSGNIIITGSYRLTDTFQQVRINDDEGLLTLNYNPVTRADIQVDEESLGTFVMRLNQLTLTP